MRYVCLSRLHLMFRKINQPAATSLAAANELLTGQLPGRDDVGGEQHRVYGEQQFTGGNVQRDTVRRTSRLVPATALQDRRRAMRPMSRTRRVFTYW